MQKQTFPCKEKGKQLWILQLLHITPSIELSNEIIQFDGVNYSQILAGSLGGAIHVLHVPHQWRKNYFQR
jgi:hypothetical protein